MTIEYLAARLNGREYGKEITKEEAAQAKAAGLIVVFGASDDLMEFRGAVNNELGSYGGASALFYGKGQDWSLTYFEKDSLRDIEDIDDMVDAVTAFKEGNNVVHAVWAPPAMNTSWLMGTGLPHASFDIIEDDHVYCRGLVFSIRDLK